MKPWWLIRRELNQLQETFNPDVVLLQRAEKMPVSIPCVFRAPVVFWSTEQLVRRRDVDQLLGRGNIFNWVYVHTYTCLDYLEKHFFHLLSQSSVMHNATGVETLSKNEDRPRLAIFNRNLSSRRRHWLGVCGDLVDVVEGQFGEQYFTDLSQSRIAVNIHFSDESLDDFETGIYEALASGCVVITEPLNPRTVEDLQMQNAVIQVDTPEQMRDVIKQLQSNPLQMEEMRTHGQRAIEANLWDARAEQMLDKFREIISG